MRFFFKIPLLIIFFLNVLFLVDSKSQSPDFGSLEKKIANSPKEVLREVKELLNNDENLKNFDLYYCLGKAYRIVGNLDSAAYHLYNSISKEYLLSDKQKIKFYTELGVVLKQQYKTSIALTYYQKALNIAEKIGDKKSYSKLINNVGRVHYELRNYPEAEFFYRRALEINTLNQVRSNSILFHNLGAIFEKKDLIDSAMFYYKRALNGYSSVNDKVLIAYAYCSLARIESNMENAFSLIDKSIGIRKELGLIADLEESMLVKANLLSIKNDFYNALAIIDTTESLAFKTGHLNILKEVYKFKAQLLSKIGHYQKAYYFQEKYIDQFDKSIDDETAGIITGFTDELKFKHTVKELEFMQMQDSLQQGVITAKSEALKLKEKQNILFLILLFLIISALVILSFLLRRLNSNNKTLKQKSDELLKSNDEKEILLKEVNHRVKNNLQIALAIVRRGLNRISDKESKKIILDNIQSVETIALIHETIYQQNQLNSVDLQTYIENLTGKILLSLESDKEYKLIINQLDLKISADIAIHLGQFICEWILNAFKHAIPINDLLLLEIGQIKEGENLYLYFRDNGKKASKNDFLSSSQFGNKLMRSSIKKITGEELLVNDENGFELKIDYTKWYEKQ